jgi:hypothetical protein
MKTSGEYSTIARHLPTPKIKRAQNQLPCKNRNPYTFPQYLLLILIIFITNEQKLFRKKNAMSHRRYVKINEGIFKGNIFTTNI